MIKFKFNKQKSIEAVLYLINKDGNKKFDLYKIVKMIFRADMYHIENYIRPVTGDYFVAMNYGPVPSNTYDLLKNEDKTAPFYRNWNNKKIVYANRQANLYYLSKSDIKALDYAYELTCPHTFSKICDDNDIHQNPAWIKHHKKDSNETIPFEELITNSEIREELIEFSSSIML